MLRDHAMQAPARAPRRSHVPFRPATGARISRETWQQQYPKKRDDILEGLFRYRWMAERRDRWDRQERENDDPRATLRAWTVRAAELIAVFTAAIAFVVGSLQVTLPDTLALRDRIWILLAFGVG
jgi:hypothetical protein